MYSSTIRPTPKRVDRRGADRSPVERGDPLDGGHRAVDIGDEEPGDSLVDQLLHRATGNRDHGCPAGHRLDDAVAEGLVEIDQVEQRVGAAEELANARLGLTAPMNDTCSSSSRGRTSSSK